MFLLVFIKISEDSNLRKEGFIYGSQVEGTALHGKEAWWLELDAVHHIAFSQQAESDECLYPASFLLFITVQDFSPWTSTTHI